MKPRAQQDSQSGGISGVQKQIADLAAAAVARAEAAAGSQEKLDFGSAPSGFLASRRRPRYDSDDDTAPPAGPPPTTPIKSAKPAEGSTAKFFSFDGFSDTQKRVTKAFLWAGLGTAGVFSLLGLLLALIFKGINRLWPNSASSAAGGSPASDGSSVTVGGGEERRVDRHGNAGASPAATPPPRTREVRAGGLEV